MRMRIPTTRDAPGYAGHLKILPSQVGNAKCSAAHWVHLSPTMLALQLHFPLLSSHSIPVEPSTLHSHAEKNDMLDNPDFQSTL